MKKILFVITKSNWGGAQRYVYDMATNLPKDEFEVAVALGGTGELQRKLDAAKIQIIQLQSVQRDLSIIADIGGFFSIYHAIKVFRPDIVHLNSSKAGGLGALAGHLSGVPRIIFTAHGWPFAEKRNVLWRMFAYLGSWVTALLSDIVICVSDTDLKLAQKMPFVAHKAVRIYNGIDQNMTFGSGDVIRNSFPAGVKITGTIGELNKNKNQISLVKQAKSDQNMHVAIIGEGEERKNLEDKIKKYNLENRVKLFGFMPASEVLKGFDIFALPSIKEGLPYVLLEAKLAGLPIVANRVGGIGEILDSKNPEEFSLEQMLQKTTALYNS